MQLKLINLAQRDLVVRAFWTFIQAAVAVLAVSNVPFGRATLIAAGAAGLSAIKTFILNRV